MKIKKSLMMVAAFLLAACMFVGCTASPVAESTAEFVADVSPVESVAESAAEDTDPTPDVPKASVRVGLIKGPSSLGMLELMKKNAQNLAENEYDFAVEGAPQDIQARLLTGELDIAAVPINLAAALYNKTEKQLKTVAVGTLGVLYLLSRDESVTDFASLAGKTVYATGQGSTPEYVLSYLIAQNGLADSVSVEFKGEHSELAALVAAGEVETAMLPQPFVTTVTSKDPAVRIAIDLNDAWREASGGTELAMTCIVARSEFLEQNPDAVNAFISEYAQSTVFVNANVDEAAVLAEKFDIIPAAVAKTAIPKCNIVFIAGNEMKTAANPVFEVLFEANPQSVGGALPDDAFYYIP